MKKKMVHSFLESMVEDGFKKTNEMRIKYGQEPYTLKEYIAMNPGISRLYNKLLKDMEKESKK